MRVCWADWGQGLCWRLGSFFLGDERAAAVPLVLRCVWMALPVVVVVGRCRPAP